MSGVISSVIVNWWDCMRGILYTRSGAAKEKGLTPFLV
jgi:hypothetical protein